MKLQMSINMLASEVKNINPSKHNDHMLKSPTK